MSEAPDNLVVVNQEEQYSVWPTDRELPSGWRQVGEPGSREQCIARIDEIWTDMRPVSVRSKNATSTSG